MRRLLMVGCLLLLLTPSVLAFRSKKPQTFTDLKDPNQLAELNSVLSDFWNLTNGRYTLENLVTNPQETRKGVKGDLVYATFGGTDHLCVNTSFPIDTDWTCIDISILDTCPGGADGQVQFNDNGDCGGDLAFLWEKNLNHAALDGDGTATPDDTFSYQGNAFGTARAGTQIVNVRDTITNPSGTQTKSAVLGQLNITQSIVPSANTYLIGSIGAVDFNRTDTGGSGTVPVIAGVYGIGNSSSTTTTAAARPDITGVLATAAHTGTGNAALLAGGDFWASNSGSGTVNTLTAIVASGVANSGGGTVNNAYGVYIEDQNVGAVNGSFGIYIEGDSNEVTRNWMGNGLGIGGGGTADDVSDHVFDVDPSDRTGFSAERIAARI